MDDPDDNGYGVGEQEDGDSDDDLPSLSSTSSASSSWSSLLAEWEASRRGPTSSPKASARAQSGRTPPWRMPPSPAPRLPLSAASRHSPSSSTPAGSGRRAAFVAGSVNIMPHKSGTSSPSRDILLPRLPATALSVLVPLLPPATRAALRATCRALRELVDGHTASLTLRPDRKVVDRLSSRGLKAYDRFPALRSATVRLAPCLPLSAWLVACGTGACLTALTLHTPDVALLEDLALSVTHPHLKHLDLTISRSGNPHASPPVVQFMVGVLSHLTHLRVAWAGPSGMAAATAALAHGPRRLFLDGRPRLGPLLLSSLADLPRLESLELQGFLIDTEGHAVLARQWPSLGPRLRRVKLSRLHLMVSTNTPEGQHLGELVCRCSQLSELHCDLFLPAAAGGAAALLISLMYATRDVKAVAPQSLPLSLTRLELPGVALVEPEQLQALGRLTALTALEAAALGPGASAHCSSLRELRLVDCDWRQLLDMLPWEWACGPPGGEQGGVQHPQQVEHVEQQGQQAQAGTPASHPLGSHVGTETEPGGLQGIGQGPREAADGSGGPVGSAEAGRHDQGQPAGPQAGVLEEADAEAGAGAAATPAAATVAPEPMARPGAEAGACSVRAAQAGAACAGQGRGEGADHHSVPLCSGRACGAAAVAASPRTATGASGHTAVSAASAALRGCSSPGVCTPLPVGSCTYRSGRSTCCGEGLQGQQGAEERGGTADGGVLLNGAAHLEEERSDKSLSRQSSSSSSRSSSSSTCSPRRDERGKARKEEPWEQGQEGATGASCRGKRGAAGLEPGGPRGQDQHRADAGAGAAGNQEVAGGGEGSGAHSGAAGVGEEGGAAAAVGSNGTSIAASPTAMGPDTAQGPAAAGDGGRLGGGSKRECPLRLLQVVSGERLDDWHAADRALLGRVARGLLPLVDAGCCVKLQVSEEATPHVWHDTDVGGKPWETAAVWRHIKAAQSKRRLQAETAALAERLARGRLLQEARRRRKEHVFVDR